MQNIIKNVQIAGQNNVKIIVTWVSSSAPMSIELVYPIAKYTHNKQMKNTINTPMITSQI